MCLLAFLGYIFGTLLAAVVSWTDVSPATARTPPEDRPGFKSYRVKIKAPKKVSGAWLWQWGRGFGHP